MNAQPDRPQLVRDEPHARALIAQWRQVATPLKTFCRDRNVSYPSLYAWKRRLDRALPVLLEVKIAKPVTPAAYEIVLAGGRSVRVGDDFHDDTLARLVATLERTC